MPFVTAEDVARKQDDLRRWGAAVRWAMDKCELAGKIHASDQLIADWDILRRRIRRFIFEETPSTIKAATQMDVAEGLQKELDDFIERAKGAGCEMPSVSAPPAASQPVSLASIFGDAKTLLLLWLAIEALGAFKRR